MAKPLAPSPVMPAQQWRELHDATHALIPGEAADVLRSAQLAREHEARAHTLLTKKDRKRLRR